ncbi:MAG: phenylalanine--tRNA ligase beta subunit-related protein, partial [Patescibacteria group bacterium]|nr:phenylalanine--tRNA ligase beta subunit-related protein [Patescibacteria group bacterium]
MSVHQTKGGEKFKSVDGISYHLPKGAVVISDNEDIVDLCGIKGGFQSGTFAETKTIFIRVPIEIPSLIRRTSQALGLRSEASSIFEKSVNADGAIEALRRCIDLILEIAGGEVASTLYDLKEDNFSSWNVNLSLQRLDKLLGISIREKDVLNILDRLNLSPEKISKDTIRAKIPTYRNDLKTEEDIIEEVARIYGYNKFPKTLPAGIIPTQEIPYFKNYLIEERIKNLLKGSGFSEIYSYSLISETDLSSLSIDPEKTLRIDNPVSREFEYLRPTLKINLLKALIQNKSHFEKINLFELGKAYRGRNLDEIKEEYMLSGISNVKNFYEIKGILERLFEELSVDDDPGNFIEVLDKGIAFELSYSDLLKKIKPQKKFNPIPKYPPVIEDITLKVDPDVKYSEIVSLIKDNSSLIKNISLIDIYKNRKTLRITYQNFQKNLTTEEVAKIREKIYKILEEKLKVEIV